MSCASCMAIEGFTNSPSATTITSDAMITSQQVTGFEKGGVSPHGEFMPHMKSQCNYAAPACVYTAQGTLMCPQGGTNSSTGYCGVNASEAGISGPAAFFQ